MSVRVLVDGWDLHAGVHRRGIGRFLDGLLPTLADRDGTDVAVLRRADRDGVVRVPAGTTPVGVRRIAPPDRIRAGIVEHVLRVPGELRRTPHDVLLSPGTLPPRRSPRPWVQTLHDLVPLTIEHPDYRFARRQWQLLGPRLRSARRVVAVSRFTADEGVRVLGLDPARLEVVPHGVGRPFVPVGHAREGTYVAAVCTDDPRKGLTEAVGVAARLREHGLPHELLVAGGLRPSLRDQLDARPGVRTLGFVDDLPALLRGAAAVVVTSRHEGFGLPALESMACGTPVVAFANTAITEVVEGAGLLVTDGDVAAMAAAVVELLADREAWEQVRDRCLARAAAHTWERVAEAYDGILREVAGS